jgi:type I restriction enzyme R subunit
MAETEPVGELAEGGSPTRDRPAPESADAGDRASLLSDARKYYVDDAPVYLTADAVYMTDPATDQLHLVEYRDYAAKVVRQLCPTPTGLRHRWREAPTRLEIREELGLRGIELGELAERAGLPDADAFDVLVHVAWNEPVLTRYDRARRLRRSHAEFFQRFQPEAREVLDLLLERYAMYGVDDLADLRALELEPVSELGTVVEIADRFGTPQRLREAVAEMQRRLYAA